MKEYGGEGLYFGCYSNAELSRWAERIARMSQNVEDSCIYFNNDAGAFAVKNAIRLRSLLQSLCSKSQTDSKCQNPNDKQNPNA